jgi:hypothetical protein
MNIAAEQHNAKQMPRIFYAKHMQPGLAEYSNERILVDTDALKSMIPSFVGKPVYINHQAVDLEKLKENAAGYVTDSFYNEADGWAWVKMLAIDDELYQAISNGWSVSNAYIPTTHSPGGTQHNVAYNRKINTAEFTHLAVVQNPRYEQACILTPEQYKVYQEKKLQQLAELKNSKSAPQKGANSMFKIFKNKPEETELDKDSMITLSNGKHVSLGEMVAAYENSMAEDEAEKAKAEAEAKAKAEAEAAEKAEGEKENSVEKLAEKLKALEEKCNSLEAEKAEIQKKADAEIKKVSGQAKVDELKNARFTVVKPAEQVIDLPMNQEQRGRERY